MPHDTRFTAAPASPAGPHAGATRVARALCAVARLPPLEQQVVIWRFGLFEPDELRVGQVADRLTLTPETVRRIERRALRSLRRAVAEEVTA